MEHVVVKTVCGFLNAEGRTLLIGVDDDGQVVGLEKDLSTLGRKPRHERRLERKGTTNYVQTNLSTYR